MTFKPMEIALAVALLLALVVAAFVGYRRWRRTRAERERTRAIEAIAYDLIRDVLLPDGNGGHIHIDFLLLTAAGFLVIDLRDVPGVIFGGEHMDEWAVMNDSIRSTIQNPLGQLYDRLAVVRQVAGEVPVEGRIVFAGRGSFPKGRPRQVVILESLRDEFPLADRAQQPSPAAAWADDWARLRAAATPNPAAQRR